MQNSLWDFLPSEIHCEIDKYCYFVEYWYPYGKESFEYKRFWKINGIYHREYDQPAVIYKNGIKEWYINGLKHRNNDRPTVVYANGEKHWYVNGKIHRVNNQPAMMFKNGEKRWYINDKLHRNNNQPAIITGGGKLWYDYVYATIHNNNIN
jgi:hypothetical protein